MPSKSATTPRLRVGGLSKTFGDARVLRDVALTVRSGEVHGLAGQNGSGKSTLIKILTGVYTPDPGATLEVDGQPVRLPVRWRQVHQRGVAVVHQDLGLLDHLPVAENVCIGGLPTTWGGARIDRRRRNEIAEQTLRRLGINLDVRVPVAELSATERAEVAIARALRDQQPGEGLVILDESTRAIAGDDLDRMHAMLRRLAASGSSAILISHSLPELLAVTDRLTVLRDGAVAAEGVDTRNLAESDIARFMLGSTVDAVLPRNEAGKPRDTSESIEVRDLAGARAKSMSFSARSGEIVGVTGLPGSGYEELPYVLTGALPARRGSVRTGRGDLDLRSSSVPRCVGLGLALVPERRDRDGLAMELPIRDNIVLPALRSRSQPWFLPRGWQQEAADLAVKLLGIRPARTDLLVRQLSGGNQQKVLLAKWLQLEPDVLVLHEPTQAVDIGARADILRALQAAADRGVTIIVVSSETEDLTAVCDRVLLYEAGAGLVEVDHRAPGTALIDRVYATS